MDKNDTPSVDAQVKEFLPDALKRAIASYRDHVESANGPAGVKFADYHRDAKICLTHIELLLKVARNHEVTGADVDQAQTILAAIGTAALEDYENFTLSHEDE